MAEPPLDAYQAVSTRLGFIDRSNRVRLDVLGPDRVKFLHNLTTNDVKGLAVGRGCEAFVTSLQGKTLAFVTLLARDDRILVRADPAGLTVALPHLQKYGVFDDVAQDDISAQTFEYHLAGPKAEEVVRILGIEPPAEGDLSHRAGMLAGASVRIIRESPTGRPGLTILGAIADAERVAEALHAWGGPLGLVDVLPETYEVLRIEAGTPVFGRDVTTENLPQEVGRNRRAISFVKGCYLGQETVARIDALGHVNKFLKGIRCLGATPPAEGSDLEVDGKPVGRLTSVASSPGWGGPVALAYVRAAWAQAGTEVRIKTPGEPLIATVADLPMIPPDSSEKRTS